MSPLVLIPSIRSSAYSNTDENTFTVELTADADSKAADSTSYVKFDVYVYGYECPGTSEPSTTRNCPNGSTSSQKTPIIGRWVGIYENIGSSGNIFKDTTLEAGVRYVTTDNTGRASFSLASSVAEAKTIKVSDKVYGTAPESSPSHQITFTEVPAEPELQSPEADKKTTEGNDQVATPKETRPKLESIEVNGASVTLEPRITIFSGTTLKLIGSAPEGSTVDIIINGMTKQSLDLDENQMWTYLFENNEVGVYAISARAHDSPETDGSTLGELITVNVTTHGNQTKTQQDNKGRMGVWVGIIILLAALCAYFVWRKIRQKRADSQHQNEDQQPSPVQDPIYKNTPSEPPREN